jgi:hypothetical protein
MNASRFAISPNRLEGAGTPFEEPNNFLFAAGRFKPQAAARAMWVSLLFRARAAAQGP